MFLKGTCFNPERGLNTGNVDQQKKKVSLQSLHWTDASIWLGAWEKQIVQIDKAAVIQLERMRFHDEVSFDASDFIPLKKCAEEKSRASEPGW